MVGDFAVASTACTVHPHGRGDNNDGYTPVTYTHGSPPRAWGQSPIRGVGMRAMRFTPTGVGTIRCIAWSRSTVTVHPHGRGDNIRVFYLGAGVGGSPPRAWGQSDRRARRIPRRRFTPTGVGTIRRTVISGSPSAVHPHGRGDNAARLRFGRQQVRFTPTGVGTI